jgi:hypothetical protein
MKIYREVVETKLLFEGVAHGDARRPSADNDSIHFGQFVSARRQIMEGKESLVFRRSPDGSKEVSPTC